MKKIFNTLLLVLSLTAMFIFSACATLPDPFNPPDFTPTNAPTDWMIIDKSVASHTKINSIAINKIPAYQIKLPVSQLADFIKPLSDGGCLAVSQMLVDENDKNGTPLYFLKAIRYKADGRILWEKSYDKDSYQGYPSAMCVFPDDSFAVSLRISTGDSTAYGSIDRLYMFAPDGALKWTAKDEQPGSNALEHLFAMQDGATIAAGSIAVKNPDGTFGNNDIRLLRFEKDGILSKSLSIGTPDNDTLMDADYSSGTGLLLSWRYQIENEQAIHDVAYNQVSQIECLGEDLSKKWITTMDKKYGLFDVIALPDGKGSLVFATLILTKDDSIATSSISVLFHFDSQGKTIWNYTTDEEKVWMIAAARLADGGFVGGWFSNTTEKGEKSNISVISADGIKEKTLGPIPGVVQKIIATKDGGFTVVLRQTVSALPQPPYISSMWSDTEAVVVHYNSDCRVEWQRSIDQYKHDLRSDIVIPSINDQLLIG